MEDPVAYRCVSALIEAVRFMQSESSSDDVENESSINEQILRAKLRELLQDPDILNILAKIIDTALGEIEIDSGGGGSVYLGDDSIVLDGRRFALDGDETSPANSKYYGTDEEGTKGFHAIPAPGVKNSIEKDAADSDNLQLVGDSAAPGNNKMYGTNGSGTKGWQDVPTEVPSGTNDGDILYWNGSAWVVSNVGTPSSGDILKWDGDKWVKLTPSTQTVVSDVKWDTSSHVFQKKTIQLTILDKGTESSWTTITGGTGINHENI
jgi:hypothetical protein